MDSVKSPSVAVLLSLLLLVPFSLPGQTPNADPRDYALAPGDQVEIRFFTQAGVPLESVMGVRHLDRQGRVFLPFVGTVHLAGLDTNGVRELLEQRFAAFYDEPVVDVVVGLRVNVTGAVRNPGNYFVFPASTVLDAIAHAGGTVSDVGVGLQGGAADPSRVRLVRPDTSLVLDLRPDAEVEAGRDLVIESGDWIHVPRQPRARFREDLQLASSLLSVVATVVALVIFFSD